MKKILIITTFVPSNKTAGQNYTLQLINDLSACYDIDLCYFKYRRDDPFVTQTNNVKVIKVININNFKKLMSAIKIPFIHPFFSCRFYYELVYFLYKNRDSYDYYYFDCSQTFLYALFLPNKCKYLMAQDVIAQKYSRKKGLINKISRFFCFLSERFILARAGANILCFSEKDRSLIREYYGLESKKIDLFLEERIKQISYDKLKGSNKFVFYGAWGRNENSEGLEWFVDNVMPLVNDDICFDIIGAGFNEKLKTKIKKYPNMALLGFVDNPYPILAAGSGLIVPLFQGAGVKVKVIESLACGTPVIGTTVAFEGIEGVESRHLLECTEPWDYVRAIQQLESIDLSSKRELRERFLASYPKDTFMDYLKQHG